MSNATLGTDIGQKEYRALAGKSWHVDGAPVSFADFTDGPGCPPWASGTEAIAYPLLNASDEPVYYAKFVDCTLMSDKRKRRMEWLADAKLHSLTRELQGAPSAVVDTQDTGRPSDIDFDFLCSICRAVPGQTWLVLKDLLRSGEPFEDNLRARCVRDLIRATSVLEREKLVHGDLSPNNVIINPFAGPDEPALFVIDFDAFVAQNAGLDVSRLTAAEGGSFGTEGYHPPDLLMLQGTKEDELAAYSDRFGRDMLILELLCFDEDTPFTHEDPVFTWDRSYVHKKLSRSKLAQTVPYLCRQEIFELDEDSRPGSEQMAAWTRTTLPPRMQQSGTVSQVPDTLGAGVAQAQSWVRSRLSFGRRVLDYYIFGVWMLGIIAMSALFFDRAAWLIEDDMAEGLFFGTATVLSKTVIVGTLFGYTVLRVSQLAFCRDEPHLLSVGPFGVMFPARERLLWLSEWVYRSVTATALTILTCTLLLVTNYLNASSH